jgi:hypothetical protein
MTCSETSKRKKPNVNRHVLIGMWQWGDILEENVDVNEHSFLFLKTSRDILELKVNVQWSLSNIHIDCMDLAQFGIEFFIFSLLAFSSCWVAHRLDPKSRVEDYWQGCKLFLLCLFICTLCNMKLNFIDRNWVSSYHVVICYSNVGIAF